MYEHQTQGVKVQIIEIRGPNVKPEDEKANLR